MIDFLKWLVCVAPFGIALVFFAQPFFIALLYAGSAIPWMMADDESERTFYEEETDRVIKQLFGKPHPIFCSIVGFAFLALSMYLTKKIYYS